MSHTTTITGLRITDLRALQAAVAKIDGAQVEILAQPEARRLFQSAPIPGVVASVRLPGWQYPVLIDNQGGTHYDNYNGRWGESKTLDRLKQGYATAKAASLARANGYMVTERQKQDGSITLTLTR
jgi:hypothetical protein